MATSKEYAWYLEGNKIAIVEKDVSFDNDINNKDYGPGASRQKWDSPKTTIADGLKVNYVYAPTYRIVHRLTTSSVDAYKGHADGKLRLCDVSSSHENFDDLFDVGDYIVMEKAGKFNGLHKVTAFENLVGTNNVIVTDTNTDLAATPLAFEEATTLYYKISVLEDESFDLDLPLYLQKALVYYVKAKLAEDAGELKLREYAMREFKKMIEKHENSRISGVRITSTGSHAIR